VYGNNYIEESVIKDSVFIQEGENLFKLSFPELESRIRHLAWVKKVSLRKQFPHTLVIYVEETAPKALLRFNKRLFLVASDGKLLEEIQEKSTSFLPVIVGSKRQRRYIRGAKTDRCIGQEKYPFRKGIDRDNTETVWSHGKHGWRSGESRVWEIQ
jgi:cell division protein FtsQ